MGEPGRTDPASVSEQETRRQGLSGSADARAVRTRQRIVFALEELVAAGDAVSVSSVSTRAGIGRSTFYTHFATVGDVVIHAVNAVFDEVGAHDVLRRHEARLPPRRIAELGMGELLGALDGKRALLAFAMTAPAGTHLRERLALAVSGRLRPSLTAARPDADEDSLRTACDYIAGGIGQVVLSRVSTARSLDESVAARVVDLLPGWLTS